MKRKIVGSMSEWSGMLKDLFRQINDGSIGQEEMKKFLEHKNPFKLESQADVIERLLKIAGNKSNFLRLISGDEKLTLDAVNGEEVVATSGNTFIFIDSDFRNLKAYETGKPTQETPVQVYEIAQNATLAQMFSDPDKMALTQNQIIEFVDKHRGWLCDNGYATFFLFKSYGKFFVAYVYVLDDGRLRVYVSRLEYDHVWRAEHLHRVVIPQLPACR